jgi:putative nucleotidyltransferase with HDIG domain
MATSLSQLQQSVYQQVERLYKTSKRDFAHWMWAHHVPWVANKTLELAQKYDADHDLVYTGALLHDLGDVRFDRDDPQFDSWSEEKATVILQKAGFDHNQIDTVIKDIISPHSCYPGNLPQTLEGQILATADALFHLQTDFFIQFCWMHIPDFESFEKWRQWVAEKLERDYHTKIFFDNERQAAKPYYLALKKVFVAQPLPNDTM